MFKQKLDLVLLDMTMSTFDVQAEDDGGRPISYAGREILRQMDRFEIKTPVIVVTQYDLFGTGLETMSRKDLDKLLSKEHSDTYRGMVFYNAVEDAWKATLTKLATKVYPRDVK
jgi:CheY-like chemotaxis protein